jgi:hypothetical protein
MLKFGLGQVAVTSIVLGALKKQGALTIDPSAIQNDIARKLVVTSVDVGESVVIRLERLYDDLTTPTK